MSDRYEIVIPARDLDAPLSAGSLLADSRPAGMDAEQRRTLLGLVSVAHEHGATTVGDLVALVEQATPAERRAAIDEARKRAGLPTITSAEAFERVDMHNEMLARQPRRDAEGYAYLSCTASDCTRVPTKNGRPAKTNVRRWWCAEHRHLAEDDDDMPIGHARIDPRTMRLISPDEEVERFERDRRRRERERARRRELEQAERETLEQVKQRYYDENPVRILNMPVSSGGAA